MLKGRERGEEGREHGGVGVGRRRETGEECDNMNRRAHLTQTK